MSKIFICDKCKEEFNGPLDEEQYLDENGIPHTFDLCAPCRSELKTKREKVHKDYFEKLLK